MFEALNIYLNMVLTELLGWRLAHLYVATGSFY